MAVVFSSQASVINTKRVKPYVYVYFALYLTEDIPPWYGWGLFFFSFVVVVVWLGFCLFVFHNLTKSSFVVCLIVFICNGSFLCLTLQHWITGKNHTGSSLPPKEQHWLLNFGFLIRYKLKIANQLVFNCIKRGPQRKLTWKQVFLFADFGRLFSQYSCIRRLFIVMIFFPAHLHLSSSRLSDDSVQFT